METVLIIEDDPALLRGLKDNFEFEGYLVRTASDGTKGLDEVIRLKPDLIILDIMLPNINGYEICRYLRSEKFEIPIIMLTAKNQEQDIVLGLNLGADDYVTKPFSIKELLARAAAALRHRRTSGQTIFEAGDWKLDASSRQLIRAGHEVKLSPKEFELLHFFVRKPERAFSRDEILHNVWGSDQLVTPRSVDRFVNALRNKIEKNPQVPVFIQTVREFGYKFHHPHADSKNP